MQGALGIQQVERRMLNVLQDTGLLHTRKDCLIQDGNEQQWRALSMARQEGEGEETSLKR